MGFQNGEIDLSREMGKMHQTYLAEAAATAGETISDPVGVLKPRI